jgi:malate dehydrogenase
MKVSIVGAGNVGSTLALFLSLYEYSNVVLIDVVQDMPQGKALDLSQMLSIFNSDVYVKGSNDYRDMEDSDIVVITAGVARKPGMSREDLLNINSNIIKEVSINIAKYAKNSIVIVVTNPLDVMTYLSYKILSSYGFSKNKVMGMAGVLDSARFKYFIHQKTGVSMNNIDAWVLGSHGDTMVSILSHSTVNGVPLNKLVSKDDLDNLVERTKNGGAEIVSLLKTGSAYYAPAASVFSMIKAIVNDKKQVMPVSVYCQGEYGYNDLVIGLPVILGKNGIEKIIEFQLTDDEKNLLDNSALKIKQLCNELHSLNIV